MEGQPAARAVSGWQRLRAILRQRCSRCCEGHLFRGSFAMNERCPACGLRFEREEGYFLGAMYVSYPLSVVLIGLFLGAATLLLPSLGLNWRITLAGVLYLPLMPWVFRMSRVIWLHFDWWVSPGTASTSEGWEKWCRREETRRTEGS